MADVFAQGWVPLTKTGKSDRMGMTKQDKETLGSSPEARAQVRAMYSNISDNELRDTDNLAKVIAERSGQDTSEVEDALKDIAKQFSNKG